jgi:HD superfamily phosphohydrolase YqeK
VLLHAPVGAFLVEKNSLLSDKKFIRAIRRHTLGPAEDFETKFLMLVDFAEYLRKFEASKKVRKIAEHDIESAIDLMLEYKKNWRES